MEDIGLGVTNTRDETGAERGIDGLTQDSLDEMTEVDEL